MKKLLALCLLLFMLTGCAPQVATFVVLPQPLVLAATAGITFVLGWLVTQLSKNVPWLAGFLGQYVEEISTAVSGALVLWVQSLLNAIPSQYDDITSLVLQLVIAVLASLGLYKVLNKADVKGFR